MERRDTMSDGEVLDVLDRMERQGQTAVVVGARYGRSRSAILGIVKRVRDDLALSEAADLPPGTGPVSRAENMNGALGPRWWTAGLAARGR